jgi:hypothetical protein
MEQKNNFFISLLYSYMTFDMRRRGEMREREILEKKTQFKKLTNTTNDLIVLQ